MAKKIRMTRKQIKKPDEFLSWSERSWDWVEEHVWQVAGIIVGAIMLFLLVQGVTYWAKSQKDSPRIALTSALNTLLEPVIPESEGPIPGIRGFRSEEEKHQFAKNLFESIISDHPGTVEAQLSILYAARSYEKLEEYDKSIDYYTKFIGSSVSEIEPNLADSALVGLARSHFAQDQYQNSLEHLNQVIESDSAFKSDAMILGARCYFRMGEKEKAKEMLERLKNEFPEAWNSEPADFLAKYWSEKAENAVENQNVPDGSSVTE